MSPQWARVNERKLRKQIRWVRLHPEEKGVIISEERMNNQRTLEHARSRDRPNIGQSLFCVPGGQKHKSAGNKTQADRVGPVNVISKVLITSWRLCESRVCWESSRAVGRVLILPKQRSGGPGNVIFSPVHHPV